jgi:FMN phosphatase YigB (HAD superfamily)
MPSIIFDIGGVLVRDVWEPFCFGPGGIAEKYGLPLEHFGDFANAINVEYAKTSLEKTGTWQEAEHACWSRVITEFAQYFPVDIKPEDLSAMTDDFIHPLNQEDIIHIIHALKKKGIKVGICSDMSSFLYARITKKLHLEELIGTEHIVVSYAVGELKMDGFRMFESITKALGVPSEDCVFFDDREVNIQKADEFGIDAVLVPASSSETSYAIRSVLLAKELL